MSSATFKTLIKRTYRSGTKRNCATRLRYLVCLCDAGVSVELEDFFRSRDDVEVGCECLNDKGTTEQSFEALCRSFVSLRPHSVTSKNLPSCRLLRHGGIDSVVFDIDGEQTSYAAHQKSTWGPSQRRL